MIPPGFYNEFIKIYTIGLHRDYAIMMYPEQ